MITIKDVKKMEVCNHSEIWKERYVYKINVDGTCWAVAEWDEERLKGEKNIPLKEMCEWYNCREIRGKILRSFTLEEFTIDFLDYEYENDSGIIYKPVCINIDVGTIKIGAEWYDLEEMKTFFKYRTSRTSEWKDCGVLE
jgi:hypothetical protein